MVVRVALLSYLYLRLLGEFILCHSLCGLVYRTKYRVSQFQDSLILNYLKNLSYLAVSFSCLLLLSCGSALLDADEDPNLQKDLTDEASYVSESGYSYYNNIESPEPLKVRIDLSDQTAYFTKGAVEVGKARVATGKAGHSTPTGSFTITEKIADKRSNLYGTIYDADGNVAVSGADTRKDSVPSGGKYVGASMPYWMRLTSNGIGMHAGPIPNPGQPASHGCIRMPKDMAQLLFADSKIGTPVQIVR